MSCTVQYMTVPTKRKEPLPCQKSRIIYETVDCHVKKVEVMIS